MQTSSNQRNSYRLTRTPVTNVVNLSLKTAIFSEKALGLTTFVTTGQKATRKTPWIDDVCNNTHPSTPKTQHARPPHDAHRKRRARLRCPWAVAGPGQASRRRTEQHQRPGPTGVEGAGGTGGHGRASRRGAERSEALASRAAGPSGARNTSGATQQHSQKSYEKYESFIGSS